MGKRHIRVKSTTLKFFKGIQDLSIKYNDGETNISGDNGTGKTTIEDSFSWILFGKNAQDQSDSKFGIKTYDAKNNVIPNINHSVECLLDVDGEEVLLKRVFKEKWEKKKGNENAEFTGNKTVYFWNEVPLSKKEYEDKISDILNEEVFKLITNPLSFNSLHWEKQRQILMTIAGEDSDMQIAGGNEKFRDLLSKLSNKTLKEYKAELASKRKLLKQEIQDIPSRIDEVNQSKPVPQDYESAFAKAKGILDQIVEVDSKIQDRNKANEAENTAKQELSNSIFELKTTNQSIEFKLKSAIGEQTANRKDPVGEISRTVSSIQENLTRAEVVLQEFTVNLESSKSLLPSAESKLEEVGKEWDEESAREFVFDESSAKCPNCKRALDSEDIETEKSNMITVFKLDKQRALESINKKGLAAKNNLEALKNTIGRYQKDVDNKQEDVDKLKKDLKIHSEELEQAKKSAVDQKEENPASILQSQLGAHKEYQANKVLIAEKETALENRPSINIEDLKATKTQLQGELDGVKAIIATKEQIERADTRIAELKTSEKTLAKQIAEYEKQEFVVEAFETKKINSLQEKVNSLFKYVKFKMFNELVDGTKVPTCEATYKGVNWNDLNTASQINCGLDIINTLCNHYGVTAPIFIDSAESITKFIPTESQLIKLIVSEKDKTLRVE